MHMGTVHGLGREAELSAQLYAQLTGRTYRGWVEPNELSASVHDVVVCTTARLSAELMYRLYVRGDDRGVPGLLFASSPTELEAVCRRQAEKLLRPAAQTARRIFVYSTLDADRVDRGTDLIIGGNHASPGVVAALSAGAAVLTITGHSDGIDLSVSSRQLACPFLVSPPNPERLLPQCQVIGRCTRFPSWPTIAEARQAGRIVPLSVIRANIGIIYSCNIVRVPDGIVDDACGLAATLLQQADLGVLLTTWRRERMSPDGAAVNGLINALCSGTMAGVAVSRFNASPLAAKIGFNFCVVGDPRFQLQSSTAFDVLPEIQSAQPVARPQQPRTHDIGTEIGLLVDAIFHAIDRRPNLDAADAARGRAVVEALKERAKATPGRRVPECQSEAGALDTLLLDFLSAIPELDLLFERFGIEAGMTEDAQCPTCFAPARSLWLIFPKRGANPRRIVRCARCHDSIDAPSDWQLALDRAPLGDRIVAVSGIPDKAQARICITSLAHTRTSTSTDIHQTYVVMPSQAGTISFQLPATLPDVPLVCRLLLARRLEIGSLCFKFRPQPNGSLIPVLLDR